MYNASCAFRQVVLSALQLNVGMRFAKKAIRLYRADISFKNRLIIIALSRTAGKMKKCLKLILFCIASSTKTQELLKHF